MNHLRTVGIAAALVTLSFVTANASDLTAEHYACVLEGAQVVPPIVPDSRIGAAFYTLNDTNELSYSLYTCYYVGEITEVHIHGPAGLTDTGPVIFTLPVSYSQTGVLGVLNDQQLHDLNCGLWYLDFHTAEYPLGVVRGRIRGLWGWSPQDPCALPVQQATWGEVKRLYR
jgi:hypothetical protein